MKITYYVKESFASEFQGSVRRLEVSVEEEYIANLRHTCYREKNYRKLFIVFATNEENTIVFITKLFFVIILCNNNKYRLFSL